MKILIPLMIPAVLLMGAAEPASAQSNPTAPAMQTVGYADLNLADPADRAALERRLLAAAREVCGPVHSFDVRGRNEARECVEATLASVAVPASVAIASTE